MHDPAEVTAAVFQIADKNGDGVLTDKEFKKGIRKLLKSDEVPGDRKFLKEVYKKADKADKRKDGKVTFDDALKVF